MPDLPKRKLSEAAIATTLPSTARVVTYTPAQDEANPALRVKTAPLAVLATALGPLLTLPGPNDRPDGFKSVRFLTRSDPRFDPASDFKALDELDTTKACLGARCYVDFAPVPYVLAFDAEPRPGGISSGLQCWRDGHMAAPTPLVPCRWLPLDAPGAQVKNYTQYPAGYVFAAGTYVGAYVSGSTTEQFFKAIGSNAARSAPVAGGNSEWELVSASDVPVVVVYQPRATIAASLFLALLASTGGLAQYVNKDLYLTRAAGLGPVVVHVLGTGAYAGDDAYLFDAVNPDLPATPVSVSVVAGALVVSPRRAFNARGAWTAGTLYQPFDSVSFNGATYYRAGAAFTSGTTFLASNWIGFGAGLYTTIDYLNEITPADNAILGGVGGKSYALNGVSVSLFDSTDQAAGAPFYGRIFAFRNVGTTASSIGTGVTTSGIDGASSLTLQPGEWIVIKSDFAAGGYTKVMRGTVNAPSAGSADTFSVLPYAASIAVDFNAATVRTLALTGNVAFTASANIALLKTKELYLTNTTGAAVTMSFPAGWSFFPGPAPTSLAAGKQAVLTLRSLGTTDSTIKAAYVAQA